MYVIQQEKTSELADYNLFSYFKHESTESSEDLLQPRHYLYQTPAPKSWSNSPKGYDIYYWSDNTVPMMHFRQVVLDFKVETSD